MEFFLGLEVNHGRKYVSQEKEIAQSPSEALKESILMPAPDSEEDSYRSEDESGASDDEYVSEFNNKNINHIAVYQNSSHSVITQNLTAY